MGEEQKFEIDQKVIMKNMEDFIVYNVDKYYGNDIYRISTENVIVETYGSNLELVNDGKITNKIIQ